MATRVWLHPTASERAYQVMLLAFVADMASETSNAVKEWGVLDDSESRLADLAELMLALQAWHLYQAQKVIARLPNAYGAVSRFNDKEWQAVVKAGTGLKIGPSNAQEPQPQRGGADRPPSRPSNINGASNASRRLDPPGGKPPGTPPLPPKLPGSGDVSPPGSITSRLGYRVDVYRSEPWLAARQEAWVAQNAALIKTVQQEYMARVEAIIRNGVLQGLSSAELAKQIREASGISERRAAVIARDQISKANAELSRYRQEDLGITRYTWTTSHDERVRGTPGGRYPNARPSHFARDRKQFKWKEAPPGGHPGMAILCRCIALPVFPGEDEVES